jgi:hypothetical protein
MVVHFCNPSYLGGESRRICDSILAQENLLRHFLKNKIQMKGLVV